ncbi:MAG: hypothetical protein Q9175_006443 [Cornicularia normoerica]
MSEFQEMRNWMRSQQCVSAATEWAAMTPGNSNFSNSNFTYASAKDNIMSSEDPDSQMAAKLDPHPYNYSSGVAPSCCGICGINAENVDIYYWPEPDADTSCLSVIGESFRPLEYGATTTEVSLGPTETSTATYWGCNPKTSTFYDPIVRGNVTYTSATTTAQITAIGSLLVKVPLIDPWSSPPCLETGAASQGSSGSIEISDKHAKMHARDHTLIIPSPITRKYDSPVTTVVLENYTLALGAVTELAPPVLSSDPKAAPVPSLTLDPGAKQSVGPAASIPVPAKTPAVDQPEATTTAEPVPSKQEEPNPRPQHNDPATQESPPSQPRPNTVESKGEFKGGNDPQRSSVPKQGIDTTQVSDPEQASNPNEGSGPKQGSGNSGDSGQLVDPKPSSDPNQLDSKQGSNQNAVPVPHNDSKQTDDVNPLNDFTGGQAKTINNQGVQPLSHGISIAGTTLTLGAPPITVSNTPIHFGSSALIIGTSTIPLPSGDPNSITTTIAGHAITAAPGALAVAGTTLTRGSPPITVSGTLIHFDSSALVVGTSTVPLANELPTQMITTIAVQAITAAPNAVAIAGKTLIPGAPGATIDGTILSLDTAGHFVVGSKTIPLTSKVPGTITTIIAGQAITAAPNGIAVVGTTLSPGAPGTTLDGTLLSLNTASQLIIGSKTIPLESASPISTTTTIDGQAITAAPNGIAVAGTALTPGASGVTVGGTLVYLNTAGQLVVGPKTIALQNGSTGLDGLILGAFGSGGPFDPITASLPFPTQGSPSTGAINGTSTGVQVFEGNAVRLNGRFLWSKMAGSYLIAKQ